MRKRREGPLVVIGALKLVKSVVVTMIGVAGLAELPGHLAKLTERIIDLTGGFPGRGSLQRAANELSSLSPSVTKRLAVFALCYSLLFAVEGIGLMLKRRWAEWMTVVVTASFIPLETYELLAHFGIGKVLALLINLAIVIYLARRRMAEALRGRGEARAGQRS